MESPSRTLARLAVAHAERVDQLNWAGPDASPEEVADGLTDAQTMAVLAELGRMRNLLEAELARYAGVAAVRSEPGGVEPLARRLGERSVAGAVGSATGASFRDASGWCAVGAALAVRRTLSGDVLPSQHPEVTRALAAGELGVEAGRLILDALAEMAPRLDVAQLQSRERFLVGEAPIVGVTGLRRLCRRLVDQVNPDGVLEREEDARVLNTARVLRRGEGRYRYIWDTDAEHHGIAQAATTPLTNPRRPGGSDGEDRDSEESYDDALADTRSPGQRLHDAIGDVFFAALKHAPGDVSGTAVTLLLTADHDAIVTGIGTATILGVEEPISAGAARRLACAAKILPAVMDGRSVPLDLGSANRLFSEAQRYALALRDGGCAWPGCGAPPSHCDAAHIAPWRDTRCTNLQNGILFCRFHHRRFDNDAWKIQCRDGIPFLIPPAHLDSTRTPRRCQQRALAPPG
ncbi:HNH endonuclease signature motif containing protein [Naasia aerilata]|uniref:HNH nuclease domain-containing protein n=1 Tax=Naasia aerilata TaxID=1162966 RepID=A0ABN6XJ42_9MICO|nr:HNH endonuclease signature motif containing protein [Naasia aerilata]BDZ44892.1 hypothetical protein GCM10025866_08010 [Naasia aerilata]